MLVTIHTLQTHFAGALHVPIEINVSRGIKFHLIGMPPKLAHECRNRVYSVLKAAHWRWPGQRITINIKPQLIQHSAMLWDVPIALGILVSSGQLSCPVLDQYMFVGNMGLDGSIETISDPYNAVELARALDKKAIFLNCDKRWLQHLNYAGSLKIIRVSSFSSIVSMLSGARPLVALKGPKTKVNKISSDSVGCFSEVFGQVKLKRALEIAVAGGHHLWVEGAPGQGKTLLLRRIPSIAPPVNAQSMALFQKVHYSMCQNENNLESVRPFQWIAPQNSSSEVFGNSKQLSEIVLRAFISNSSDIDIPADLMPKCHSKIPKTTLAFGGMLVVDELLKQKETVRVGLLRELDHYQIQVFGASNPCPCGQFNTTNPCKCSAVLLENHRAKMTGALKDRFDIRIQDSKEQWGDVCPEQSRSIRNRVVTAWERQMSRQGKQNAQLTDEEILKTGCFSVPVLVKVNFECKSRGYSYRGRKQLMALCLTIMDLGGDNEITEAIVNQALELRMDAKSEQAIKKMPWVLPKVKV